MMLVSITPGPVGEPCAVRVYSCAKGSRLKTKMADVRFDQVPNKWEVMDLARRPLAFIEAADRDECA